jgi:hypothetical protein
MENCGRKCAWKHCLILPIHLEEHDGQTPVLLWHANATSFSSLHEGHFALEKPAAKIPHDK